MPTVKGHYAMNPAQAKRKAAEAEPDEDDLIPQGHELDEIRIKPADNGFTVNHTTRVSKAERERREKASKGKSHDGLSYSSDDYRGKDKVFEDHGRAAGHVLKVMAAHHRSKGKK